ncbi:MAG: TolC family protein [Bacteroidales bacterium]|jgi:cobalt-zinc-cadmium efflux system outer membrane protein|nr:TolC family protein [Bacteroidales bacterium]
MKIEICLLALLFPAALSAQTVETANMPDYARFMENVKESNIDYMVEKYNVDIAQARVQAARVFPDPGLSLGATDNQERKLRMGYSLEAGLDYNLELGGKRQARMFLAQSEAGLSEALLLNFFRNLRADATLAYLTALYQKQLLGVQRMSYRQMAGLARADSIRCSLGEIGDIDARQSKLEAGMMWNDVVKSEAELQNMLAHLCWLQGSAQTTLPDSVAGVLSYFKRVFELPALIAAAQDCRADLQAALRSKEVSERNLRLAKANRAVDLGLSFGVSRNARVRNEIAPAPAFTAVTVGVNIPLKFSNMNRGEVRAGQLAVEQSEAGYRAVEIQIQAEVIQAYNLYAAACRQVENFNSGHLTDAATILQKKIYSYERGETNLLEVLHAQRTFNDVQEKYYETLYGCAAALVELERASGINLNDEMKK